MKQQNKGKTLEIHHHTFQITPLSIALKGFKPGVYQLELDKGCQWIGKVSQPITIARKNEFAFSGNDTLDVKTHRDKNLKVRLSLYQQDSSQSQEYLGSVEIPLNSVYNKYQDEISKRKREYEEVVARYFADKAIGDAWGSMKYSLAEHTQHITRANSEGSISINIKVGIWSVLDQRVKEEQQFKLARKKSNNSQVSHVSTPKSGTSLLLPPKQANAELSSISNVSPMQSRVKDFAQAVTREQVEQSTPSPVKPIRPSAAELRLEFKQEQLSDVIQESNENTTGRIPKELQEEKIEEEMKGSKDRHRLSRSKTQQVIKDEFEVPLYMKKNASLDKIPGQDEQPDQIEQKIEEQDPSPVVHKQPIKQEQVKKPEVVATGGIRNALIVLALLLVFLGSVVNIPALKKSVRLDRLGEGEATVRKGRGRGRGRA